MVHALSWAVANQTKFWGRHRTIRKDESTTEPLPPPDGWAGRWDKENYEYLGFTPARLKKVLESQDYDYESAVRTWRDREWIIVTTQKGKVRNTKKARMATEPTELVAIKREIVEQFNG